MASALSAPLMGLFPCARTRRNASHPRGDVDVATRNFLDKEQMTWLRGRPYGWVGPGFACTHGEFSGPSGWGYITRPSDAWPSLWSRDEQVLFVGHTHVPLIMMMSAESARKMKSIDEAEANEGMRGLKVVKATA